MQSVLAYIYRSVHLHLITPLIFSSFIPSFRTYFISLILYTLLIRLAMGRNFNLPFCYSSTCNQLWHTPTLKKWLMLRRTLSWNHHHTYLIYTHSCEQIQSKSTKIFCMRGEEMDSSLTKSPPCANIGPDAALLVHDHQAYPAPAKNRAVYCNSDVARLTQPYTLLHPDLRPINSTYLHRNESKLVPTSTFTAESTSQKSAVNTHQRISQALPIHLFALQHNKAVP